MIYISVEDGNDDDDDHEDSTDDSKSHTKHRKQEGESSSDDNDSTAAARAAATGQSPQPVKSTITKLTKIPEHLELGPLKDASELKEHPKNVGLEVDNGIEGVKESGSEAVESGNDDIIDKPLANEKEDDPAAAMAEETMDENPAPHAEPQTNPLSIAVDEVDDSHAMDQPVGPSTITKPAVACLGPPKAKKLERNREINLNERDEDENTALHVAVHRRKLEHVKILLEAGASFRIRCDGSMPIHTAISIGALRAHRQFAYECVVMLHEHGADLAVKDDAVHTPLFLACTVNLPQVVSYILSHDEGLSTLNIRADRAGNRPLHAAAKFDTLDNPSFSKSAASVATGLARPVSHRQPDGCVVNAMRPIPGYPGKQAKLASSPEPSPADDGAAVAAPSTDALLTQLLLSTSGIEVDALNVLGQTPLHVACMRRNWPVARLLLQAGASPTIADRRGHTPGHLAHKRAMPIPDDLYDVLGDPPESGLVPPLREFIVDPDGSTLVLCHELCLLHHTCPPILRDSAEPPPENVRRLQVLVDPETGILRSGEFGSLVWTNHARRAAIADVLKVSRACMRGRKSILMVILLV